MQQFHAPPLTKTNKFILIAIVAVFILHSVLVKTSGISINYFLGINSIGIKSLVNVFTYFLAQTNFTSLLFEGLLLWFIGSELESRWGRRFYIEFFVVTTVGAGIIFNLLAALFPQAASSGMYGISAFGYALLMAYAIIYPQRQLLFMFVFPMQSRYFCALLGAMLLYFGIMGGQGIASIAQLLSMGLAFAFLRYKSAKAKFKRNPPKKKKSGHLKLVDDEDDRDPNDPKYFQ